MDTTTFDPDADLEELSDGELKEWYTIAHQIGYKSGIASRMLDRRWVLAWLNGIMAAVTDEEKAQRDTAMDTHWAEEAWDMISECRCWDCECC